MSKKGKPKNGNGNRKPIKKKDVWKIAGLVSRIEELIHAGTMNEENGLERMYETIRTEFGQILKERVYNFDKKMFRREVLSLIWSPSVMVHMTDAVRHRLDADEFYKTVYYIPKAIFMSKWYRLAGKMSGGRKPTEFVRGVLRLGKEIAQMSGEPLRFPRGTFDEPYEVLGRGEDQWLVPLNGINIGIPHSGVIEENPARQVLEVASYLKASAVIVTNFLDIDTKKAAGPLKVYRSLISGRNVNPEDLDPEYSVRAQEIMEKKPHGDMIYETTAELLTESLRGLLKIVGTSEKPTFDGPMLFFLGRRDEDIITAGAYWEAHYFTVRRQTKLNILKRTLGMQIARAYKEGSYSEARELEVVLNKVSDELSRTIVSNITSQDLKRYYYKVLRFVVKRIESTVPNSKVVGIGTKMSFSVGGKRVDVHIPEDEGPTDTLLSDFCSGYGPSVLQEKIAPTVIICHPFAINHRRTVREADYNGERHSVNIYVAPITIDERFVREQMKQTARKVHNLSRAVSHPQFKAGALFLKQTNGVFQPAPWSIEALQGFSKKIREHRSRGTAVPCIKYIWMAVMTDPHFGSPSREILESADGQLYGVTEAVMEMMRRDRLFEDAKMPVHLFTMNDDPTQGHHFDNHTQPDPRKMSYAEIEKRLTRLREESRKTNDFKRLRELLNEITRLIRTQLWLRGEHWVQNQVEEVIERLVDPNVDFFNAIMRRALKAQVRVRGISHFNRSDYDRRDVGVINLGTGNHILKSTNRTMTEGFIYARLLKARLTALPPWDQNPQLVDDWVKSPLYGNQYIAWGTVGIDGGYEWGLDLRDTPSGKGVDWNDTLLLMVRNDLRRGNYNRIRNKRKTIVVVGDKHFYDDDEIEEAFYHMSASDTHTDLYGELGFPPNNTGVSFIGMPVEGPNAGPILSRVLTFDHIKPIFEQGLPFDWQSFLPNPA